MQIAISKIVNSKGLLELLSAIDIFCGDAYMRDDDSECMELKEQIENITDSDIHTILASYLSVCENGDEIIESLCEFANNCRNFAEADEDMTQQVTKAEFETILSECENKCNIHSYIDSEYKLKIAEVPMIQKQGEMTTIFKNKEILLLLPRIDINTDIKQYISEELGGILYEIAINKFKPDVLIHEINRYIPETRKSNESVKELFRKHFYSAVLYKERNPGTYPEFDDHIKQVLDMEFFKRLISEQLLE